jgi:hypothetical protein
MLPGQGEKKLAFQPFVFNMLSGPVGSRHGAKMSSGNLGQFEAEEAAC